MDFWEIILLVLGPLLPIAAFVWCKRRVEPQAYVAHERRREEYVEAMTDRYGEPQQMLWTGDVPLLFYEDFMVMDGVRLPYDSIVDVTCNNSSDFGPGGRYQVIVRTSLAGHEFLHTLMDNDMQEAIDMVEFIHSRKTRP